MDDGSLFTSNVMHIVAWMVLLKYYSVISRFQMLYFKQYFLTEPSCQPRIVINGKDYNIISQFWSKSSKGLSKQTCIDDASVDT